MDLLSNNSTKTSKVSTLIFEALKEVGITPEEMSIAEKFFDFSSELDISLLDKIKCREFPNNYYGKCINAFTFIENQKKYLYFDRYVLFFDALMGNLAHRVMYRFSNFAYWYNQDNALHDLINHAYAQRYDEIHVQAKLMAMFADIYSDNISNSEDIRQMAQSNPEVLYVAFKDCCIADDNANPQLVLAANALAYSSPNREGKYLKLKNKIERKAELSPEHAKEMADYIVDIFDKNVKDFQYINIFQMIMSSMFTAIDFDDRIESKLLEQNVSSTKNAKTSNKFLTAVLCNVPNSYFDANLDRLDKLIELDSSEIFTQDCIKTALSLSWSRTVYDEKAKSKGKMFIMYCVEHYPKAVVAVMNSTDKVVNFNGQHNQNASLCCCRRTLLCRRQGSGRSPCCAVCKLRI